MLNGMLKKKHIVCITLIYGVKLNIGCFENNIICSNKCFSKSYTIIILKSFGRKVISSKKILLIVIVASFYAFILETNF